MTLAMFFFASADAAIKMLAATHPQGQIIWITGMGGAVVFTVAALSFRQFPVTRDLLAPPVLLRVAAEAIGTVGIVMALSRLPLAMLIAIMQAVPLVVTMGAAVFLGEAVGWRRWAAILVGFAGVLIIIRPGTDGFSFDVLYAVIGVIFLAVRDLCTQRVPATATNFQLGIWGFAGLVPAGLMLSAIMGTTPGPINSSSLTLLAAITFLTVLAILFITMSMRKGDVAVIAPFRYTRLLFGLALAIFWFGERPDATTWFGAAIVAGSGIYTFARERRLAAQLPR